MLNKEGVVLSRIRVLREETESIDTLSRAMFQAAKEGGSDSDSGNFDVHDLDGFMKLVVELGAFEHVR